MVNAPESFQQRIALIVKADTTRVGDASMHVEATAPGKL